MTAPSKPLPVNQAEFEEAIFREFALTRRDVGQQALAQFLAAEDVERWGSGAGFYSDYTIPKRLKSAALSKRTHADRNWIAIKGVDERVPVDGLPEDYSLIGCIIRYGEGFLRQLECFNYGGGWPTELYEWRLVPDQFEHGASDG